MPSLSIVVPCYNEEEVLRSSAPKLLEVLKILIDEKKVFNTSAIYFVDDGSRDATWSIISELTKSDEHFKGIKLAHNRGHQNALLAGLFTADSDIFVTIDADLQDDVNAIAEMVERNAQGAEIVYGVRNDRTSDSYFKRSTAKLFYTVMAKLGVDIIYNHADFRLMSRRAVEALGQYRETNMFLRGLVPLLGFQSDRVEYAREKRQAGESKYPLRKMLSFAWDGITSFSVVPLRFVTVLGILVSIISLLLGCVFLFQGLFSSHLVPGWATITVLICFLFGVQIFCIGIVGEYIGKIFQEVKRRPKFFIEKIEGLASTLPKSEL